MEGDSQNLKEGLVADEMSAVFLRSVEDCPEFAEAIEIVRRNVLGSVWLIGGFVYRMIVRELYCVPVTSDIDFDFIVEIIAQKFDSPPGWVAVSNSYGNPKLKGPRYEIDLVPLDNIHSVLRRGLEPTIENFLSGTPLTVQSIAYDVSNGRVIGDIGVSAIRARTVGVNDVVQANHRAELKGKSVQELVREAADSLDFDVAN